MDFTAQAGFDVRVEQGHDGLKAVVAGGVRSVVIVDVLSFSTCVSVAVERGARVYPYPTAAADAQGYAAQVGAVAAGRRGDPAARYTLSPASLRHTAPGERILLPSPNGATLSFEAAETVTVLAGCLRNRTAVARFVARGLCPVGLIAAGERWPHGTLRPALEDLLAAGAIAAALPGRRSPEAAAAVAVFERFRESPEGALFECSSGRELRERGFEADVEMAAALDVSGCVPILRDGYFGGQDDEEVR